MATLRTRGASFAWEPGRAAVEGAELDLAPGFTALLGPNGSGKSTLLRLLAGLLVPAAGSIALELSEGEVDPARGDRTRLARQLAFLPSRPEVPPEYTALELVLMGRHPFGRGLLLERPEDVRAAEAALERAGALPFRDRVCETLSSGERQRVLVARALCQGAAALLLDEPTSAQDPAHALDLFGLFAALAQEGRTVVVATHDLNAAARFATRLVVLERGRIARQGSPAEVLAPELLRAVFAVEAVVGRDGAVPYAVPRERAR